MVYPNTTDLKITIGGDDVTAYVPRNGDALKGLPPLVIEQEMGRDIDEASFGLADASALSIQEWDEVIITNDAETERYFAGYLMGLESAPANTEIHYICDCLDYTAILEKAIINEEWEDTADNTILGNIKTNAEPALTAFDFATNVTNLGTVAFLRLARRTVRDALEELADRVGAEWYIDYNKNLHWFSVEAADAAYSISDDPDLSADYPCGELRRLVDGHEVINRVTIVGGDYLSGDVTHEYAGDNQQVRFTLPYFYREPTTGTILIDKNTGSDVSPSWSAQTVGIKYIDDAASPAKNVLFAFQERFVEFATAPSNLARAWRITARYQIPLRTRVRSDDSYDRYGQWLEGVIVDSDIKDKTEAQTRGKYYLAANALAKTVFSCKVYEPGLRAGEIIRLVNDNLGVDDSYFIRSLTRRFPGGGHIIDELELGDYIADLFVLMAQLARKAEGRATWRDDEILDELLQYAELLSLSEATSVTATSTPYTYLGGANDFNYGFGVYS